MDIVAMKPYDVIRIMSSLRMHRGQRVMASSSSGITIFSNGHIIIIIIITIINYMVLGSTDLDWAPRAQSLYQISWKSVPEM
jgi:hypothetical protein